MSEVGVPYKERPSKGRKFKVPHPPDIPTPAPEEPVPGDLVRGKQKQMSKCPICGTDFTSTEELQQHIINNHPGMQAKSASKESTCPEKAELCVYDNNTYNLMRQMLEEHQMLWQIKNYYLSDAAGHKECYEFWESIIKQSEARIEKLEGLLKKHMP